MFMAAHWIYEGITSKDIKRNGKIKMFAAQVWKQVTNHTTPKNRDMTQSQRWSEWGS